MRCRISAGIDDDERSEIQKTIKEINPNARLELAEYCRISENILDSDLHFATKVQNSVTHQARIIIQNFHFQLQKAIDPQRIENLLKKWRTDIFRIKGYFKDDSSF